MRKVGSYKLLFGSIAIALLAFGLAPAAASSANISHSYLSNTTIPNGSIVSLESDQTNTVEPANSINGDHLLGVALNSNDSLLAINASTTPGTTQVATSGTVNTLVSTINGSINVGDSIGVSPFNGIGIEALPNSRVIGVALTSLSSNSANTITTQVKNKSGQSEPIQLGYIQLNIDISTDTSPQTGPKLSALQKLARSLTGKTIPTARIFLSLGIGIVAIIIIITLIQASIRESLVSIGRNPLAEHAIWRSLLSVMSMVLLTSSVALVAIFFLLH
jgi:hypothetical protein